MWLRAERVDEGGRSPGLREWHKCENANCSPKDRRWAEDRRFDHSCKLCVAPREPPVDVRPVAAARSAAAADLAAAPPPEHHQPQQRIRGQATGVDFGV